MTFRADLHCHSYFSDGVDAPLDLLVKAKAASLQGLSITDHDTLDAYTPDVFLEAKKQNIRLLPGVEISSEFQNVSVHILGYGPDLLTSRSLQAFLQEIRERRRLRNLAILEKLSAKKMPISEQELFSLVHPHNQTIGRPHIAEWMIRKGYVSSFQEAFEKYLKEGASCHAFGIKFHPQEVIEQIHLAGGRAVLAHPHFFKKGSTLREILSFPFQGIECYYGILAPSLEEPWVKLAQKKGWLATGGSDDHGRKNSPVSLGCSWVGEEVFNLLFQSTKDEGKGVD